MPRQPEPPCEALKRVAKRYAVKTTPYLDALMSRPPLARQYRPRLEELKTAAEDVPDPIGDAAKAPLPGLVHRYRDRVLLKPVHVCAAYCRFCFRREMVGPGSKTLSDTQLSDALDYIAARPEIWEVVMTGGDPLLLAPRRLRRIVRRLSQTPHVEIVRLHSRLPMQDPARVTPDLAAALASAPDLTAWVAIHVNHAAEFTPQAIAAIRRLTDAGVPLVSQSVLLRGVNDDVATLTALFRACVRHRIKPYYLHHPDLAPGTSHFRLSVAEGRALVGALRGPLSGLAQPTYVIDRPGGLGKLPLGPVPDEVETLDR